MSGPAWFTPYAPERHTIVYPGAQEEAARIRYAEGSEAADAFLAEHTAWVEVRGLTAGDRAQLDELRFSEQGEGKISFGEQKIKMVELCLTGWSLDLPVSPESIRSLNALVLDAIIETIPEGRYLASGGANGSGPPPQAAEAPPADAKETVPAEG